MRTPALARFHNAHDEINSVARCAAGGLSCLREFASTGSADSFRKRISELSPHWGANLPFALSDKEKVFELTDAAFAELLVVRSIANFEAYLDEIDAGLTAIGYQYTNVDQYVPDGETESLLKKLSRVAGPKYATLAAERDAEISCLRFFLIYRNRQVHSYGSPSPQLQQYAESDAFLAAWARLGDSCEGTPPTVPKIVNDRIWISHAHAILSSILASRLAAKCDEFAVSKVSETGVIQLAIRVLGKEFAGLDGPQRAKKLSHFIHVECKVPSHERLEFIQRLKSANLWQDLLEV